MAVSNLVLLGCAALTILTILPTDAQFLNEDLVFEDSPSPVRWRTYRHTKVVNSKDTSSVNIPVSENSVKEDSGLWGSAVKLYHRVKRWDFWNPFGNDDKKEDDLSSETKIETEAPKTTTVKRSSEKDTTFTEETSFTTFPKTTLPRETRSTDQVDEFNKTDLSNNFFSSLRDDTDYSDLSGSGTPDPDLFPDVYHSSTAYPTYATVRVYHRVTLKVVHPFSAELSDRNSNLFREFSDDFAKRVDELFEDLPGTQKSGVINIERSDDLFDSKVTLDISSEGYDNPDEIERLLKDHINKYNAIGNYRVHTDHFSFRNFGARPEPLPEPQPEQCLPGYIECPSFLGGNCVAISSRCNGSIECKDGRDEAGCPPTTVQPVTTTSTTEEELPTTTTTTTTTTTIPTTTWRTDNFEGLPTRSSQLSEDRCRADDKVRCADGSTYICDDQKCDGTPDCPDGDDETDCPNECSSGEFMCDLSRCILSNQRCDGITQCDDGTDEQNCPKGARGCMLEEFECRDGSGCIPRARYCDNIADCRDDSDEEYCPNIHQGTNQQQACDPLRQFECGDMTCIESYKRCDGNVDCPRDGNDEYNCSSTSHPARICTSTQFTCRDGTCIDSARRCNRMPDCPDNSDEQICKCTQNQFECENTYCIPLERRCDGFRDCQDESDEKNCNISCAPHQFTCRNGGCIDSGLKCDRRFDCMDGSDEENCDMCHQDDFRCSDGQCLSMSVRCNGRHDCRNGEDERFCPNPPTCQPYEFECRDRSGCVSLSKKCNGFPDCQDASDEENCGNEDVPCPSHQLSCGDGNCVNRELECDGTNDCRNGADEKNCPTRCRSNEFLCDGSRCVPNSRRCDGRPDCSDRTDEANCAKECRSDEFKCGDGSCISQQGRCDGRSYDCQDGSDERNCPGSDWREDQNRSTASLAPDSRISCSANQFSCSSGDQCVPQSAHCDNNFDCRDYSDESNCAGNPDGLNLKTYPADQIIKESREVVFQCRDEGPLRASVRWTRGNGLPLPPGSRDIKGRLEMPNIQLEHTGTYVCEAVGFSSATGGSRALVYLKVEPFEHLALPTPKACGFNEATCSNGECISKTQVCDGQFDCTDGSDEMRCNLHGCEPNEFRCDNKKCVQKTWRCDSDDDCGDGSDERNCAPSPPGSKCRYNEYQCQRVDQCIPKAFHCDMEVDCQDGSDEWGCSKAEIQKPPPSMIVKQPGETFTISCTAVGTPTPEVVWRLNWGHIPPKCQTTSVDGYGTLTCPNIQESDQGAYSCEALNNRGSTFAIPDTILVVKPLNGSVCSEGTFNELAVRPEDCIPCFCFGVTTSCRSADLFIYQLPPPLDTYRIVNVFVPPSGGVEVRKGESQFQANVQTIGRSGFQISLTDNELSSPYYSTLYPYFALPENYHGNQLKSYGGYIKYTIKSDGTGAYLPIPDVILSGNGYTLVYKGQPLNPRVENNVAVRFFPGNWYRFHPQSRVEYPATRQELMMALDDIDQLLIRTQYFVDGLETTITDINVDSAAHRNNGQGKAAFVEQCSCPAGYSGLSCETCETGYMHQQKGQWLGTCEPPITCPRGYYLDPRDNQCKQCLCPRPHQFGYGCRLDSDLNITCDCPAGYEGRQCEKCSSPLYVGNPLIGEACTKPAECDAAGSLSPRADPSTGRCLCKDHATGPTCNQCKPNTFNLASGNQFGCINCFCMGINTTCTSSDLYRTQIVSLFTRDNQEFTLAQANRLGEPITDIQVNPSSQEIYFNQFNPGTYYWVLPGKFLYNQVTSYGGYLRYTLRYIPTPGGQSSPNSAPDVEIVGDNGVHLVYYNREQPQPEANRLVTVSVPLREQYWQRVDGASANREQLMMALAELQNILIKATYTTNTQEAALKSVHLDTGTRDRNTGQVRAVEVEQCQCPVGYRGTSCEECDAGYTRLEEGLYLGTCEPCNCHGFSTECDPDTGLCLNCRGNTRGARCEHCLEGYQGDPTRGVPCSPVGGCDPRSCDPRGSVGTCDHNNQCTCKTNVIGVTCSECRQGTFDLSRNNLDGCTECFCSGVTGECQSSNLYREAIPMQIIDNSHQFTLTDTKRQVNIQDGFILNPSENEIGYDFAQNQRQERLFWSLPPAFTGNKVLSYGGNLNFTQRYSALPNHPPSFDTDVIIVGPSLLSISWTDEELLRPDVTKHTSIPLKENAWRRLDPSVGLRPVSRPELMRVLSDVQALLIRATPSTHTLTSHLSDVSLDTAVSQRTGKQLAVEVELCRCPSGYRGTSCESCSGGYYQDFDGKCKLCPCNGNEEHCSLGPQQQVVCTCKSNFGGTYCDRSLGTSEPRPHTGQPTISISITEPAVIVIEAGKDITFRCTGRSLTSSNPINLEWSKQNGVLPYGRAVDNRQGVLLIKDVKAGDSGTYICTASDGYTFVTERALLQVGGSDGARPVVTVTPRSLDVREGEPVEFRCEATGVPAPNLNWLSALGNGLPPTSSFSSGMFRIPSAKLEHQGEYICTGTNREGEDSETVSLYVRSAPVTSAPAPPVRLNIQPQDYNGFVGDTVKLECVATESRNIRLQWSRSDGELSPNARDADGIFTIYKSQPSDSGIYTCTAIDRSTGTIEQEVRARINVNAPHRLPPTISIEPPRQTVSQGSTTELRCITQESPVQWSKAGDSLPTNARIEGNILRLENIQVRDRGVYVCQVDGPGGLNRITSIIEVERREVPMIELFPKEAQVVNKGGSVLFQCRVIQGIPEPTVHWSRVDHKPLSRQVEQLPNGVLRFNTVTEEDEGKYLCTADNQEGSATTVAELQVHSLPIIMISPVGQTVKASLGQRVRLDCQAHGRPTPTVSWSKHQPGYAFYDSKSVTPESSQGAVYEIKGVTASDEGSYSCKARNAAGEVEERIQLIVSDEQTTNGPSRGDIPSDGSGVYVPNDDYTIPLGGNVNIRCVARGLQQNVFLDWSRRDRQPLGNSVDVRDGTLYINQAQYADSGDYQCQARNRQGEVLFSAIAEVRVIEPMQIKLEPERQVVRAGDNARITCTATGTQPITLTWAGADNRPLPPSVRVYGGIIEFIGIREDDAGTYLCRASNSRGVLQATADVIVNENQRPSWLRAVDRNQSAIEGSSVTLRCDTPQYQEISWSREDRPLSSRATVQGSFLRIDNLQREDTGRYICRTTGPGPIAQDYIDLNVDHINDIELQIEPSSREVHHGDTVDLQCLAVGPNHVQLYWSRADGGPLPPNSRQTGSVLRISSATTDNMGLYKCTAVSRNSRVDKDYYLTVHDDRPTHDAASAETETAEYGQTARLKCDINLEGPITHTWTKHGGVLPASAQISGPELIISSITYKDAGLYICTASNGNIQADIPKIILVRGAVPFFNQAPYSYLALPTLSNGYLNFNIELTFKPERSNGLILYNGQHHGGNGDFISFGLRDGIPEFRFDVGSGVGIVRGNQSLSLGEWHTVQLHRNKKQGTMYVDDNQYYTGYSSGRMQGLDLSLPLFLGGVADFANIHKQNGFDSGFVGCISRLVINNKEEIDIMKEKKDSEGVTSCETCALNPCVNTGVCQEAPTKAGYMCLCPRGYSGLNCSHTGEPCYPGACGSGRCLDTDEGIECYCGLGKIGEHCERDLPITEPSFSGNSFMAYPTPKALSKTKIVVRFNAADTSNGLLLYCAENDDGTGKFLSLSLRDRHLEFKYDAGSGVVTLRSMSEIVPGHWVTANAGMGQQQATLSVTGDNVPVSRSVKPEMFKFMTPLYVGGYDKQRIRPAAGVGVKQGFRGCVNEVQVSGLNLDLMRSVVDSANIGQCSGDHGDPCQLRPCQHNGRCHPRPDARSYTCDCPTGYTGDNCEVEEDMCATLRPCRNGASCVGTPSSYKCNCPLGYAGTNCDEYTEVETEAQFNGDGYIELSRDLLPHTNENEQEVIEIEFTTRHPNGIILWHGQTPNTDGTGQDYLSVSVVNGQLQFSYELGSKPAVITSPERVDDGQLHRVEIKRQARDGSISVDGGLLEYGESRGILTQLNTNGNIYIGGLPHLELMTGSHNATGFTGCVHSLHIQNSGTIDFGSDAISAVNVLPCDSLGEDEDNSNPQRGDS